MKSKTLLLFMALMALASCRTLPPELPPQIRYVEKKVILRDTVEVEAIRTILVRDSSSYFERNDTIIIKEWHWKEDINKISKLQVRLDSALAEKMDSIPYEVVRIKEINITTPWQKKQIAGFWILSAAVAIAIALKIKHLFSR